MKKFLVFTIIVLVVGYFFTHLSYRYSERNDVVYKSLHLEFPGYVTLYKPMDEIDSKN